MKVKELRVYFLSADEVETNAYDIENWSGQKDLPKEAKDFINQAEENGNVYSLRGFQDAINFEEFSTENTWVFITDKY